MVKSYALASQSLLRRPALRVIMSLRLPYGSLRLLDGILLYVDPEGLV
jgi:hypothetical protein